jgi:hypothetical protein
MSRTDCGLAVLRSPTDSFELPLRRAALAQIMQLHSPLEASDNQKNRRQPCQGVAMLRFEDFVESSRRSTTTEELARMYADAGGTEGYENCILTSLRGRKLGHIAWFRFPHG